jgi:hypothetical protein
MRIALLSVLALVAKPAFAAASRARRESGLQHLANRASRSPGAPAQAGR